MRTGFLYFKNTPNYFELKVRELDLKKKITNETDKNVFSMFLN